VENGYDWSNYGPDRSRIPIRITGQVHTAITVSGMGNETGRTGRNPAARPITTMYRV